MQNIVGISLFWVETSFIDHEYKRKRITSRAGIPQQASPQRPPGAERTVRPNRKMSDKINSRGFERSIFMIFGSKVNHEIISKFIQHFFEIFKI